MVFRKLSRVLFRNFNYVQERILSCYVLKLLKTSKVVISW